MKKLSSLSIFFPVFNDENTIAQLITDAYKFGSTCANSLEVIAVNDGSADHSTTLLKMLQKKYPKLVVITHKTNKGYGAALSSGFKSAKNQWVFYTDADGQYTLQDLPRLVSKVTPYVDVVNGYKRTRADSPARALLGNIYNHILHKLYSIPISDIDCDFRLIKREFLDQINLQTTSGGICLELVLTLQKAGARFAEIDVHHYRRKYGRSQFMTTSNLIKTLKEHMYLYFMLS